MNSLECGQVNLVLTWLHYDVYNHKLFECMYRSAKLGTVGGRQ